MANCRQAVHSRSLQATDLVPEALGDVSDDVNSSSRTCCDDERTEGGSRGPRLRNDSRAPADGYVPGRGETSDPRGLLLRSKLPLRCDCCREGVCRNISGSCSNANDIWEAGASYYSLKLQAK